VSSEKFSEKVTGTAPPREIDYEIEFIPGAYSISKTSYRMAPTELKELQIQLDELLQMGFIRPSVSPWGCPSVDCKEQEVMY